MLKYIQTLEKIADDKYNWSKEVREACRAGADALKWKENIDKLLKCWEVKDGKHDHK